MRKGVRSIDADERAMRKDRLEDGSYPPPSKTATEPESFGGVLLDERVSQAYDLSMTTANPIFSEVYKK